MFSPEDLERIAREVAAAMNGLLTQRDDLLKSVEAANARALEADRQVDRITEDLMAAQVVNRTLLAELQRLNEELKKVPSPPPLPPPIEVAPAIEVNLEGIGSFHAPLRGERQGREVRYRGSLNPEVDVVVDVKDDGQVATTIERCWAGLPQTATPIQSKGTFKVGETSETQFVRLHRNQRPRHVINPSPPPPFDLAALIRSNLIPNYSGAIRPSETDLAKIAQGRYPWEKQATAASYTEDYGQVINSWVGGAGSMLNEASHLMPVQLAYLLTGDARAWKEVVRLANSSGNYAIHYKIKDEHGGHFPTPAETGTLPFLQTEESITLRTAAGIKLPVPDVAHQHSLCYVPYLLTGERFYREELRAWTVYNLLSRPKNADRLQGIIFSGQVRSAAWALRSLLHTWHAVEFDSVMELDEQIKANLNWMNNRFVNPSSPDHRKTGVVAVSAFRPADLLSYVTDEPKPGWFATWNHHVLASVLNECRRAGFPEAIPILNHVLNVIRGVWEHSQSKYDLPWGNHVLPSDNWPAIIGATFRGRATPPQSFQDSGSKIAGDYLGWARSAVVAAVDSGQAWAPECLRWIDAEAAKWKGLPLAWQISPSL